MATVIVVTASGALAPGPLTFAVLVQGSKEGAWAGFCYATGHMFVELPLVLAMAFGMLAAANQPSIRSTIGTIGGLGLIGFGILQICGALRTNGRSEHLAITNSLPAASVMFGLALTGLNPYFIIWWLTIGSVMIIQALAFAAILGVVLMYISHVWMDYVFLTALAYFGNKGKKIVGSKYYRIILAAFGIILIYYGVSFAIAAIRT